MESLRLMLMQDFLPVGIAIAERAKRKGGDGIWDALTSFPNPLQNLRSEGQEAAEEIREQLDKLYPGLGNPVMSVKVNIEEQESSDVSDIDELMIILEGIEDRIESVKEILQD